MVSGLLATGCAGTAAAATTGSAPTALSGAFCRQASDSLSRMIEVTATMRPIPDTEQMALRFQLLERLPGGRWHRLHGGDLGRWRHPNPPTFGQQPDDTWVVNKPVVNLHAPAVYRFRVTFRWLTWDGVITTAVRRSPLCIESQ